MSLFSKFTEAYSHASTYKAEKLKLLDRPLMSLPFHPYEKHDVDSPFYVVRSAVREVISWLSEPEKVDLKRRALIGAVWVATAWLLLTKSDDPDSYVKNGYTQYSEYVFAIKNESDIGHTVIINNPPQVYARLTWVTSFSILKNDRESKIELYSGSRSLWKFDTSLFWDGIEKFSHDIGS